jgi:DNA-binding LytR/AlgR family response regulator
MKVMEHETKASEESLAFQRVHRSAIVNLARVRQVCALPTGEHVAVL